MKKLVTFIIALTMSFLIVTSVQAKSTVDANIVSSKVDVKTGEYVEVTLGFDEFMDVSKGLNAFKATLNYDENIFGKITDKDFVSLNDWELLKYNPDTKEFVAIKKSGSKETENIVSISLKVKDNVKVSSTYVGVTDLVTSEGKEDIFVISKDNSNNYQIKLNIISEQDSSIPSNDNNNPNNNKPNNNGNNKNDKDNKDDDKVVNGNKEETTTKVVISNNGSAKKKASKLSITNVAIIVIPLFILLLVLHIIIVGKKDKKQVKKLDDLSKKERMLVLLLGLLIVSIQSTGIIFAASSAYAKGDINQDDKVDYADAELLEYHLIHVSGRELIDDKYSNADMNNDTNLTVTDLSLLVSKIERVLDYDLVVSDVKVNNYYPKKNEDVIIEFTAQAKYDARVTSVTINDTDYEAIRLDNNKYQVIVPTGSNAGLKTFNITNATLYNGQTEKLNEKITVDVQKDKPSIKNYVIEDNQSKREGTLSFDLVDNDNSLTFGNVQIKNKDNGNVILDKEIKAGTNKYIFDAEEDIKYSVIFYLNYDLATNELEQKQDCKGQVSLDYDYQFNFDYNFNITNIKTYKNGIVSTIFEKNEEITLGFNSTNNSEYQPSKIMINGIAYDLKLNGDRYEVLLRSFKDSGVKEFKITSVTLNNNKKFDISESIKVEVLKDSISLSDYSEKYNIEDSTVTLEFNINDKDKAFVMGKVYLVNNVDNTKQENNITSGHNKVVFSIKEDIGYSLKINAVYARDTEKQNVISSTIKTSEVKLVHDYELSISNLLTYKSDKKSIYFNKGDNVTLGFNSTNNTSFNPVKVFINGTEYTLNKVKDQYQVNIGEINQSGVYDIKLESIILENGKQLSTNLTIKIEVLKDIPKISNFAFNIGNNDKIDATFILHDNDSTIKSGTITVIDSENNQVYTSNNIIKGKNTISFNKTMSQFYNIIVKVNYDLDTNTLESNKNEYNNHILLSEEIEINHEYKIEMKDIQDISLYKQDGTKVNLLTQVNISDLNNLSNYLVKVDMKKFPSFYAPIKSYRIDNGVLRFTLDYDKNVQYDKKGNKYHYLEVEYGIIENNVAERDSIDSFIERIMKNPNGNYKLTHDMDFSSVKSKYVIDIEFTGTLDGNGYSITNLSSPLFKSLNGATLKNLVIRDAYVKDYGVVSPTMASSTIQNVHLKDITVVAPGNNGTGSLTGIASANTLVENCSAVNVRVGNAKRTGGLIGKMNDTTVRNTYLTGRVSSTSDGSGGLIGEALSNTVVENCYVNVITNFLGTGGSIGGLIGNSQNTILKNNLSLANSISGSNHGSTMFGKYRYGIHGTSINNYELETSNLTSNSSHKAVSVVSEDTLRTKSFYINTLGWSEDIWDFTNIEDGEYPTLKGADPNYVLNRVDEPKSDKVYIPDYGRISKLNAFDSEKEILYNNLNELMPFYDSKYFVLQGAKIPSTDILNKKRITGILPLDENNQMIGSITEQNASNLRKIKVLFDDKTSKIYNVTYQLTENNIATYIIDELGVYYNYNKYLLKSEASIINELVAYANRLDYTNDLDPLTSEADSRLYRDYYNEQIKPNIREFVLELLQYNTNNVVTIENNILNNKIRNDYIESGKLKEIIYAYNYYKRWYSINIGGCDVADIMMIHGEIFENDMTIESLTEDVMNSNNRATNITNRFYEESIQKYTNINNVTSFLDDMIISIGGYKDVNDWFTENWQGAILEVPAQDYPDINYRAWQHMKAWPSIVLPFLTLPENAGFIVSSPTSFLIGGQRVYIADPFDPAQHEILINKMNNFGTLVGNFYNTIAGSVDAEVFNRHHDVHYDTTKWMGTNGKTTFIEDASYQSEEPYMKNFNEAVGQWPSGMKGVAAYAFSNRIYFRADSALDSFGTWSHESAHSQDGDIFFKGGKRRPNGLGEDYSDGNIAQYHGDGGINFNLAYHFTMDDPITTNLTPERINTSKKMQDYYRKMFETLYVLDYIEAQAFLRLTPEEQAKVSVRVSYPNAKDGDTSATAYNTTTYTPSVVEDIRAMNLRTMADLWDNKITIRPGVTSASSVSPNKYGGASLYNRRWYQPHNDYGRPDSYSFKYLAWEMMGYAGYDNGYINYFSNKTQTDLTALRTISGNSNITWREYKLERFDKTASVINNIAYIDAEELIKEYEMALKNDAKNNDRNITTSTNLRRIYYHYLKRVTNDFRDELLKSEAELEANNKITHISSAKELQDKITEKPYGYYVLDNDIDVSQLTGENAIIDSTFFGKLDGRGHTITGNKLPVFNKINYSVIRNLKLKDFDVNYVGGYIGLANNITSDTRIYKVTSSERKINISSLEEFLKIGVNPNYPLGKSYNITADIDFSGIKRSDIKIASADYRDGNCIVTGIFTGIIYGNGHTFSNLNRATLFNDFRGSVTDLNISNFTNKGSQNYVAAFARVTNNATLVNMKFKNITLSGFNDVAPVTAMDGRVGNSKFTRISVENANVSGSGVYISAFIGRKFGGSVKDCFVQGTVSFQGAANGGVFGAIENNESISNVISNVTIIRKKNNSGYDTNGGMFGQIVKTPLLVENSIAMGNITHEDGSETNISKFLSKVDAISKLRNCYEYKNAIGVSNVNDSTNGKLNVATNDNIHDINFYKNNLHLDSNIWDFSTVPTLGYPILK